MIKNLFYLLLLAGIAMGPAYWIHAKFFTGHQALTVELKRDADGIWRADEFEMRPDMAPAGLILHAQGSFSPNMEEARPPRDRYAVTLSRNGEAAKPLTFAFDAKNVANSNPAFKEHLVFLQTVLDGRYRIEMAPTSEPGIQLESVRLEVRANLREPDPRVTTAGMVVLVLGVLGLIAL